MSSKKYDSIIINVYFFEEGNFWNLSATGYIGDNDPENVEIDPNSLDPNLTEDEVKEEIKMMGEGFIDPINDGCDSAALVCLHLDGSEFECLTPEKKEENV